MPPVKPLARLIVLCACFILHSSAQTTSINLNEEIPRLKANLHTFADLIYNCFVRNEKTTISPANIVHLNEALSELIQKEKGLQNNEASIQESEELIPRININQFDNNENEENTEEIPFSPTTEVNAETEPSVDLTMFKEMFDTLKSNQQDQSKEDIAERMNFDKSTTLPIPFETFEKLYFDDIKKITNPPDFTDIQGERRFDSNNIEDILSKLSTPSNDYYHNYMNTEPSHNPYQYPSPESNYYPTKDIVPSYINYLNPSDSSGHRNGVTSALNFPTSPQIYSTSQGNHPSHSSDPYSNIQHNPILSNPYSKIQLPSSQNKPYASDPYSNNLNSNNLNSNLPLTSSYPNNYQTNSDNSYPYSNPNLQQHYTNSPLQNHQTSNPNSLPTNRVKNPLDPFNSIDISNLNPNSPIKPSSYPYNLPTDEINPLAPFNSVDISNPNPKSPVTRIIFENGIPHPPQLATEEEINLLKKLVFLATQERDDVSFRMLGDENTSDSDKKEKDTPWAKKPVPIEFV